MSADSLLVRVVRTISGVAPGSIGLRGVREALPEDKPDAIAAILSQYSRDKGPLVKVLGRDFLEYRVPAGFDFQSWFGARAYAPTRPPDETAEPIGNEAVQIVRVLHRAEKRMTASEIYEAGNFSSRTVMMLQFASLCAADQPLFRERIVGGRGSAAMFHYAIREGFDVDAWLAEHEGPDASPALADEGPDASSPAPAPVVETPPPVSIPARVVRGRDTSEVRPAPVAKQDPPRAPKPPPDPTTAEPVIKVAPLNAADACAELLRHAHAKLMEAAEASADPLVARRAREVRVLNDLRKDFERTPA